MTGSSTTTYTECIVTLHCNNGYTNALLNYVTRALPNLLEFQKCPETVREIRNASKRLIYVYEPHKSRGPILLRASGLIKVMLQGHANYFLNFFVFLFFRLLSVLGIKYVTSKFVNSFL
jgi:hypothetical protein